MKKSLMTLAIALLLCSSVMAATSKELNLSDSQSVDKSSAQFIVQSLKYDPYPVNAGDWFDVWVKIQNIGQDDAPNLRIKLMPEYPFTSNDSLVRDYGALAGSINAYRSSPDYDASQIVVKFRVKVAESAPEGSSNLKLSISPDYTDSSAVTLVKDLPIEIGKTKSDFDVTMQEITAEGTSFMITNTGENKANAITLSIKTNEGISLLGPRAITLGPLDQGEFTIAHIKAIPDKSLKEVNIEIAYTDNAGTRTVVEKTVPIEVPNNIEQICQDNSGKYTKWIYGIVGVFIGIIVLAILMALEKKLAKR